MGVLLPDGMMGVGSSHVAQGQRQSGEWERKGLGICLEEMFRAIAEIGRVPAPVTGAS